MTAPRLDAQGARLVHLAAQGLLEKPPARATKEDLVAAIRRMKLLQIDTIHVVARSPYLVLFSRVGAYPERWLDELLEEGRIAECWAHEACFVPWERHPLHLRWMTEISTRWSARSALRTRREHAASMDALLAHVRERGPVKVSDFERRDDERGSGWWAWKDEKRWLEAWFALGELMIARRERFQRVYDLRERVIARVSGGGPIEEAPSHEAISRAFTLDAVRALGVTRARWIADYFRTRPRLKDDDLAPLVAAGDLVRVEVRGWDAPGYVHRDNLEIARRAEEGTLRTTRTALLSPFDPVVWDRERALSMFDFDYRIECYTPAPKRRYGYFVLPILHRGRLVGRLDAKAHRADGVFEVKAVFLEPGVTPTEALAKALARAIRAAAEWHGTPEVVVRKSEPRGLAKGLRAAIAG